MQTFTAYILFSEAHNKIYIGFTNHLINRFHSHNSLSTKGWTTHFRPWTVIYTELFATKQEAMVREMKLKQANNRRAIREKIISQFYETGFITL